MDIGYKNGYWEIISDAKFILKLRKFIKDALKYHFCMLIRHFCLDSDIRQSSLNPDSHPKMGWYVLEASGARFIVNRLLFGNFCVLTSFLLLNRLQPIYLLGRLTNLNTVRLL